MRKNPSITKRLLLLIIVPVVALVVICAGFAARMASESVNELYDQQMQTNAGVLLSFVLYESYEHDSDDYEEDDDDAEELLEIAESINAEHGLPVNFRLKVNNRTRFESAAVSRFPSCENGFTDVSMADADPWRCYRQVQMLRSGDGVLVEIFESQSERKEAIRSLVLATFSPIILLPLLVAGLTYRAVAWAMKSLRTVSHEVSERSADNLQKLNLDEQPSELLPVAASVNQLLDSIEKSIQREKQFTDDAAHELRTPVTSIKMLEQLLRRDNQDPALHSHLDDLRDSVNRSSDLIDQLLSFARIQSTQSMTLEDVDVSHLLRSELGFLSPQITDKRIAIELNHSNYVGLIRANETALSMLLRNLLSNAVKFSNDGGVVYLILDNHSLVVEDDGPGIDTADRPHVFDRFYRSSKARTQPGSGLGLTLAKWVADAHTFELRSDNPKHGKGASFVLVFNSLEPASELD